MAKNLLTDHASTFSQFVLEVENIEVLENIDEELMQESKTYQRQVRKITIEYTLDLLEDRFHAEAVSTITPELRNINDLQKLKQLHLAASKVQSIEAFAQMLHE